MSDGQGLGERLKKIQKLPLWAGVIGLAALAEKGKTAYELVGPELSAIGAIVAFVVLVVALWWFSRTETGRLPELGETKLFFPFAIRAHDARIQEYLVDRKAIGRSLHEIILAEEARHVAIVGSSGSGKSTLLKEYVFQDKDIIVEIDEYNKSTILVLCEQLNSLSANASETIRNAVDQLSGTLLDLNGQRTFDPATLRSLLREMLAAFETQGTTFVVFDQAERLVASLGNREQGWGIEEKIFGILLSELRAADNVRTVFTIRSEFAVSTFDALLRAEGITNTQEIWAHFRYYHYLGIVPREENRAFGSMVLKFSKLGLKNHSKDLILRLTSAELGGSINAFKMQLIGYMAECFNNQDAVVSAYLNGGELPDDTIYDRVWYYLKSEYNNLTGSRTSELTLFVVAYTISVFNRYCGAPISVPEISHFSGLPQSFVQPAATFLERKGILRPGPEPVDVQQYRMIHDLLRDHVLAMSYSEVRTNYKDAIRSLIERTWAYPHSTTKAAPSNRPFLHRLVDVTDYKNPAFTIIALMMLVCIFRLLVPHQLLSYGFFFFDPLNHILERVRVHPFELSRFEYFLIMIPQFMWVTFMFQLNENFFVQIFKGKRSLGRWTAAIAAPGGALLGGATVFAPALYIVPIFFGGAMLSLTYWIAYQGGAMPGVGGLIARELGKKTSLNMAVTFGLVCLFVVLYSLPETITYARVFTFFFALCFVYFHEMMKPRQCTPEGWGEMRIACQLPSAG